jgi:copper chaperone CopZ
MKGTTTMSELTFHVPGMTCGHCEAAVKGEVTKVAGVSDVQVDLTSKIVTVAGDTLDTAAIVAAIDEAGFEVSA